MLVAAALWTDSRTTAVPAETILKIAKSNPPHDPEVLFLSAPLQATRLRRRAAERPTKTASDDTSAPVVRDALGKPRRPIRSTIYRPGCVHGRQTTCRPQINWDIWRPLLSLTFSAVIGLSSTLVPTSAALTDFEGQSNSATAACWEAVREEHVHPDQTVHLHYTKTPCNSAPEQQLVAGNAVQRASIAPTEGSDAAATSSLSTDPPLSASDVPPSSLADDPPPPEATPSDAKPDLQPGDSEPDGSGAGAPPEASSDAVEEAPTQEQTGAGNVAAENADIETPTATQQETGEATSLGTTD